MKLRENFIVWMTGFLAFACWESAIRIFLYHQAWSLESSFASISASVLLAALIGLTIGILHALILFALWVLNRRAKFLQTIVSPAVAIGTAAAIPFLLNYRFFLAGKVLSPQRQIMTAIAIAIAIFVVCAVAGRLISKRFALARQIAATGIFIAIPLLLVVLVQSFRNSRFSAGGDAPGPIRHVVLISIDTLRFDYVGAYGAKEAQTPVLDQIAAEGALFKVAISLIPQTGPSHMTMLTGLSPIQHRVLINGQPLPRSVSTVTEQLHEAGFHTGGFIAGYPLKAVNSGLDQGFQHYSDQLAPIDFFNETPYRLILMRFFPRGVFLQAKEVTDLAMKWLEKNNDGPFFLFLHYYDPHYPYGKKAAARRKRHPFYIVATPESLPVQKQLYAEEVHSVDTQIGRVVDLLKRKGIYENTLLIITADHGESLGEHNYYYDHDRYVYEQLIRVPMIVHCPVLLRSGTVVDQQVALPDVYKTILANVGLSPKNRSDTYDLVAVAKNRPAKFNERLIVSHSFVSEDHSLRAQNWKLIRNDTRVAGAYELYNLLDDPGETRNLFQQQKNTAEDLRERFDRLYPKAGFRGKHWTEKDLSPEQREVLRSLGYFGDVQ